MTELMGVCGGEPEAAAAVLERMARHVGSSAGEHLHRWAAGGVGLLHFCHAGAADPPQPASSADGRLVLMADGEPFPADGAPVGPGERDAVLAPSAVLGLYSRFGEATFRSLSGSFALALYDTAARRLLLVTDRLASRPVFHCRMGESLAFASRFNALVACGALDGGRLDTEALMQFLTFQQAQLDSTLYCEAKAMPPAAVLDFCEGRLALRRYWRRSYDAVERRWDPCVELLTETLRRAGRRMTGDAARKGVLLSGGLDSRVLVAASVGPMTACTAADSLNREVRTAARVARTAGWPHVVLRRPPDHYLRVLDRAVELSGGMERFDHCHFLDLLDPLAGRLDALFNEDAMDPLLKGYYWDAKLLVRGLRLPLPATARLERAGIEDQVLRGGPKSIHASRPWLLLREPWRSSYRDVMHESLRRQFADADTENPYNMAEHAWGLANLGRSLLCARGVRPYAEYRALGFDADLAALATRIPVRFRARGRILAEALRRLDGRLYAIPYANTGVRLDTPAALAWGWQVGAEALLALRRRAGLVPPTRTNESWPERGELLRTPQMRSVVEQTLLDPSCLPPAIFDTAAVRRLIEEHMSRRHRHMRMLLCLLTLGRWFSRWGPREVG